jgi:hypothetical protein
MTTRVIERDIKRRIKDVLSQYKHMNIYVYMSVPGGYGTSTLDYIGFLLGYGFAIEAKRPGAKPTPRQQGIIEAIEAAGCPVFVISDDIGLAELAAWLDGLIGERITSGQQRRNLRLVGKDAVGRAASHHQAIDKKPARVRPQRIRHRQDAGGDLGG